MSVHSVRMIGVLVTLLGVLAFWGTTGFAQQKVEGMVVALKIEKCGMQPGSCEGTVEIGEPGKARTFRIEPGTTTIKKGGHPVVLQELMLGDRVTAEFERKEGGDIAKLIEVRGERAK
ncbi:MAG: hypothetical protein HYZ81_06325 [Nitrospinae bacterium]|nr:hypothetical protein [Nitrospinota bacterium]